MTVGWSRSQVTPWTNHRGIDKQPFTLTSASHPGGPINLHVFELWEEAGVPGENPPRHWNACKLSQETEPGIFFLWRDSADKMYATIYSFVIVHWLGKLIMSSAFLQKWVFNRIFNVLLKARVTPSNRICALGAHCMCCQKLQQQEITRKFLLSGWPALFTTSTGHFKAPISLQICHWDTRRMIQIAIQYCECSIAKSLAWF